MTTTAVTDVTQALRNDFRTDWTALANGVPVAGDNNPNFQPPVDSNGDPEPWLRLTIQPFAQEQDTMGALVGGFYAHLGQTVVEIFVPLGEGSGRAHGFVDDVVSILRGQSISNVQMLDVDIIRVGDIDGVWFKLNVSVQWRYSEVAA